MPHTQMSVYGSTLAAGNIGASDEEGSSVCEPCQTLLDSALDEWDEPCSWSADLADHCVSDTSPCHICRLLYAFLSMLPSSKDPLLSLEMKSGHDYQALVKSEDPISRPTIYLHDSGTGDFWVWQPLIQVSWSDDVSSPQHEESYPQNADLAMAVQTVKVCEESHGPECQPRDISGLVDLRVIDCDTCEVVKADGCCQFVALSYVWGRSGINATITDAPQWEHLPPTIQQSINVTKKLGYRFLWVDRFVRCSQGFTLRRLIYAVYRSKRRQTEAHTDCADGPHIRCSSSYHSRCSRVRSGVWTPRSCFWFATASASSAVRAYVLDLTSTLERRV